MTSDANLSAQSPNCRVNSESPLIQGQPGGLSGVVQAQAFFQLGEQYRQQSQFARAAEAYTQALLLDAGLWQAYALLAEMYERLGHYEEAITYYGLALQATPSPQENWATLLQLGGLYKRLRVFEPALQCYRLALQIQPAHEPSLISLSQIYRQQGDTEAALALYRQMLATHPQDMGLQLSQALALPIIYPSVESVGEWRCRVESELEAICSADRQWDLPQQGLALHGSSFYLAYQGYNDCDLAKKIAAVVEPLLPTPQPLSQARWRENGARKPKIGIISRYLAPTHTVGKLMQGIIRHFDRETFDVLVFSIGEEYAYTSTEASYPTTQWCRLPADNVEAAAREIQRHQPDLLLYADIGMNITSYCLAGMRLAPVQCVTWGHPVTTGLRHMDYFISSELLEPEDAQHHYSERLIRLKGLPTYYVRPQIVPLSDRVASDALFDKTAWGLSETQHFYLCPQSLFKLHPQFDACLQGILQQDPQGIVGLLSHYAPEVNAQLQARFERTIPDVAERIGWIPRQEPEAFQYLLQCADVLLDPIGFGGGNTTYEAFSLGLPIVTCPGSYMRGRVTAACYQKMGLSQYIASTEAEYIQRAVAWGTDSDARRQVTEEILDRAGCLYEDMDMVRELEAFFLQALQWHSGA